MKLNKPALDTVKYRSGETLITLLVIVIPWLMGIVIAQGIISTLVSILFAPYAWYLTVEHLMQLAGLI